ncbi:MAG: protein kinase [Verrucomicrobiota bacterium]
MSEQISTPVARASPSIPDYELLRPVGRGAYGEVWLARNVTGSFVALKIVQRAAFDHDRPFEREFEGIQRFEPISRSDPSQVAILYVGRGEGFFYYVMELADAWEIQKEEGRMQNPQPARSANTVSSFCLLPSSLAHYAPHTLKHDLRDRGALPADECLSIALSLTRALSHLHGHGLVHRDVKPSNVIFVNGVAKLADIGLVTSVDATRSFVGTDGYLPPEGAGTPQADLYSLGKVLYEMSTGSDRKEFPALPPDIATRPDRDHLIEFNAIIIRACTPDARQRYQTAEEMRKDLELLRQGKSVKRIRSLARWGSIAGKAAVAAAVLVILIAIVPPRLGYQRGDVSPDGPPSTNELANTLCIKALMNLRYDNFKGYREVLANLRRAIALDPHFAKPYVGLLGLRSREGVEGEPVTSAKEMHGIAEKLRKLAPNSAPALCAESLENWFEWDFPKAEELAKRAIRTDPKYEFAHRQYASMLMTWDRPVEARKEVELSQKILPSKGVSWRIRGHTYFYQRDYTNAIATYLRTLEWEANHQIADYSLACAYRALGNYSNAITYFEKADIESGDEPSAVKARFERDRAALASGGPRGYWQEEWNHTKEYLDGDFYRKAEIQFRLGDTNAAIEWLNRSFAVREKRDGTYESPLNWILYYEVWDPFRKDKRFIELLNKIGFTKVNPRLKE